VFILLCVHKTVTNLLWFFEGCSIYYQTVLISFTYIQCWLLTYQQAVCGTTWNDIMSDKRQELTLHDRKQRHFGQSEDWIFCVSLVMGTCKVWHSMHSRICQSIERHFKCSVDTLTVCWCLAGRRKDRGWKTRSWRATVTGCETLPGLPPSACPGASSPAAHRCHRA